MIHSIRTKFMVGLTLVVAVLMILLNYFVGSFLESNNEAVIESELNTLMANSNVFVRQSFLINNYNNEKENFNKLASDIVAQLKEITQSEVAAYTSWGRYLSSTSRASFSEAEFGDIQNAVLNKTSYSITKDDQAVKVYFSYPVVIADEEVGILRFYQDYTTVFSLSDEVMQFISYATIAVFSAAFVFIYLLSTNISRPLSKLSRATAQVSQGNMVVMAETPRSDEIGSVIRNFNHMVRTIEKQINIIKRDRDALQNINQYRKDFYDHVTHELKTPLTTILGYAEILQENGFTDHEFFQKGMQYIIGESKRLNDMVIDLLEFSKVSSENEEPMVYIDLSMLVGSTIEEMSLKAKRYDNRIVTEIPPGIYAWCMEKKMKQVYINLLDNAIKYGERGTDVFVRLSADKKNVHLIVQNKGEISMDQIEKIFIPFYRIDKNKEYEKGSSGLGLSIVKRIVDDHRGEVHIYSDDGLTTATVMIPRNEVCSAEA
ncbi:MAG: sensor histidine kinase [Christensenellales bacterium]